MLINFNKIDVHVNGTGLLASNASVTTESSTSPVQTLGRRGAIDNTVSGPLSSNLRISYLPELTSEPNYLNLSGLKENHNQFNYAGIPVAVGGITGTYYLDTYSFSISPNQSASATVSYISFLPLSGSLQESDREIDYNTDGYSGLSHGWTTRIDLTNHSSVPIYNFDYNFRANWQPVYKIGQKEPIQVSLMGMEEEMSFVGDIYTGLLISGQSAQNFLNKDNVNLITLNALCGNQLGSFNINLSGAQVVNTEVNARLDDFVRVTTNVRKVY